MPLTPSVLNDTVNFYSQYPIDKIVGVWEGSFNKATDVTTRTGDLGDIFVYPIAHGFTRPVFVDLLWSDDNVSWADGGASSNLSGEVSLAFSDATNIYIIGGLFVAGVGTRYYKVIAYWIDNYDTTNPLVSSFLSSNKTINLDSRLNYQKIYDQDVISLATGTTSTTVIHDFGYEPNARVFFEAFPNEVWPLNFGGASNPFLYDSNQEEGDMVIENDNITINITDSSTNTRRLWYRIYVDDDDAS